MSGFQKHIDKTFVFAIEKKCKIYFENANYPKYISQVDMYIVHDIYYT